jgi:DNA-binding transcriptional ArsR family regulator
VIDQVDEVLKALADPTRRRIVEAVARRPFSVSELTRPLSITLPAVLQHLAVLERCGLVETRKRGRVRTCQLRPDALAPVEEWLSSRRHDWERRLDDLATYLGEDADG